MATVQDVIRVARKEVGYREKRVNNQKYSPAVKSLEWSQNQPWCHTFISWVFQTAGAREIAPVTASCLAGVDWFRKNGRFGRTPRVGAVVYYGANGGTHVELVTAVKGNQIRTIGGNTYGTVDGQFHAGDGVYEKWVNESKAYGYGYPDYETKPVEIPKDAPKYAGKYLKKGSKGAAVKTFQARLKERGWKLDVDGEFGPETERIVKEFQEEKGFEIDGVVGPETWYGAWSEPVTP